MDIDDLYGVALDRFVPERTELAKALRKEGNLAALLATSPDPGEAEIRAALNRNLCRCGAHNRIVRAVQTAAKAGRDG